MTITPSQDSWEVTTVLSFNGFNVQTCMPLMPSVLPIQTNLLSGSISLKVEVIDPGPAFHLKLFPTVTFPLKVTFLTFGFQLGQLLMSVNNFQTVSGDALSRFGYGL